MIGIFDSGLGGLSVLAAIARQLPRADLCYVADTAHVPYGPKSDAYVRGRVLAIGQALVERGCTLIVVACNTATAAAIAALREALPGIPVVGVEPGVKPAALHTRNGCIAVLATESTSRSERLARLIREHASHINVLIEPCPGWATRVETLHPLNAHDDPTFAAEVAARVQPLLTAGADQVVLGCTHYAFLTPLLTPLLAGQAQLVDVAEAVARQVLRQAPPALGQHGQLHLYATARPEQLHAALPALGLQWLAARCHDSATILTA